MAFGGFARFGVKINLLQERIDAQNPHLIPYKMESVEHVRNVIRCNLKKADKYIFRKGWFRLLLNPELYSLPTLEESRGLIRIFGLRTNVFFPSILFFLYDEANGYKTLIGFCFTISFFFSLMLNIILHSFHYQNLLFWFFVSFAMIPSIFYLVAIHQTKVYLRNIIIYRKLQSKNLIPLDMIQD